MKKMRIELAGREEIDWSASLVIEVPDDITEEELQDHADFLEALALEDDLWNDEGSTGICLERTWSKEAESVETPIAKLARRSDGSVAPALL